MRAMRATVGLLFSDIEGSTRLLQQLGPMYGDVLLDHRRLLRGAFAAHSGVERSTEGDSFFVTFPTASDAVGAALAGQLALATHQWPSGVPAVRVRMGVHAGEIEELAETVVGMAVHEAARLCAAAYGGQVLGSGAVEQLAHPLPAGASWRDLGEHQLRDISTPMRLLQLAHEQLAPDFPAPRAAGAARNNLPPQPSSFIGREREVGEVQQLLETSRLVTVTGTGGAGKTRIALRAAAGRVSAYADGAWFVDLAAISDPGLVLTQLASTLSVPDPTMTDVSAALARKQTLLVMDNCEHVIETVSEVISELVRTSPDVTVLATSREPLGIPGEAVWRVPPMERADAVALLTARAAAANPAFAVTEANRPAVDSVCQRLDAIPLALELAAARLGSLTVEQLAGRLDQRFRLLAGGVRGVMERHRTLQATVDWSFNLLDEAEQRLLRRLGVFVGGFDLDGVTAVAGDDDDIAVLDLVDRLVAKSLVVAEPYAGDARFRLLETVRQYAVDRLSQAQELDATRDAHLRWMLTVTGAAGTTWFLGGDEAHWLARFDAEDANLRAALDWALTRDDTHAVASMLFGAFGWFTARGRSREGLEWTQRVTTADAEDAALVTFLELCFASNVDKLSPELVARTMAAVPALATSPRPWLAPVVHAYCTAWSYPAGDRAAAQAAIAACEHDVEQVRGYPPTLLGFALQPLIWVNLDAGHVDEALRHADDAMTAAAAGGLSLLESRIAVNRARISLAGGDLDEAWQDAERSARVARSTGETFVVVVATRLLADVAEARGDYTLARDLLVSVIDAAAETQRGESVAQLREALARCSALAGAESG